MLENEEEQEIFRRVSMDENIYNSRGCDHAPNIEESGHDRYLQMGCCAQMYSYQWSDMFSQMSKDSDFDIVEVRFKNTHKDFFRITEAVKDYQCGDIVAVESSTGHDMGIICLKGELVRMQLKNKGIAEDSDTIRKIYRKARPNDIDKWVETIQIEKEIQRRARVIASELGLNMKINNVEYQGDSTKAIFYYTADERVDFRQLIKLYADEFKVRIEMKQIGARQEAGNLGGIGSCGRELCCVTFLHNFISVSTHAARLQQVSLNPQKLAGQCGKLKCCLNFEYDVYTDAIKSLPDSKIVLDTEQGSAQCIKTDPLKKTLTYVYDNEPGHFFELNAEAVFKIIELNRSGKKAMDLMQMQKKEEASKAIEIEFQNVVGQDELTRFDKPQKNKKKHSNEHSSKEELPKLANKIEKPNESKTSVQRSNLVSNNTAESKELPSNIEKHNSLKIESKTHSIPKNNNKPNNKKNKGTSSLQKPILK
ncbi:MAG: regulatory iron-sulfur-containing complex subunit RicT [Bacteroidales bacterium]